MNEAARKRQKFRTISNWLDWLYQCWQINYSQHVDNSENLFRGSIVCNVRSFNQKWQLPQGMEVTLTDTVGFIQDLPTQLIEAFQSTLEESRTMDLLLHVVDASAPDRLQHERTVQTLMKRISVGKIFRA